MRAAAIAPAWQATRVSPLDAMAPRRRLHVARLSGWMTVAGLLLICLNPLLVFYLPMADTARYAWSAAIGCAAMALGFVLLTPITVIICERVLGPLVGAAVLIPLSELTRSYLGGSGRGVDLMIYGALIILVALARPQGLASLIGVRAPAGADDAAAA